MSNIYAPVNNNTRTKNPVFKRGSTIAEAIKEKWPACPVVGVTNANIDRDVDIRTQRTYDALYQFEDLLKYISRLEGIAGGFLVVARKRANNSRKLIELMVPPKDDISRLIDALPDELKALARNSRTAKTAAVASLFYSWIERLMARPGFLYDDLWSATLLGLNGVGFKKVAQLFKPAEYCGVFWRDDDPRWWRSRLEELLYKRRRPKKGEMSWQTGRRLPGIIKSHFSQCHVCKDKDPPETVGYLDVRSDQRYAMHLRCTVLDPRFKRELYFEDIRMMLGT